VRWLTATLLCACGSTLTTGLLDGGPDAGITLSGWVVDASTDAGLAGATVQVGAAQVTTDSDGTFTAPALTVGLQSVQVTAQSYWDGIYMVQLAAGDNPVELVMERDCSHLHCPGGFYCGVVNTCEKSAGPAAISGHVTDSCDGTPRVALVEVLDVYGSTGICADSDGSFRIEGRLAGEPLTMKLSAPGFTTYELPFTPVVGENDYSTGLSRDCGLPSPAQQCR
jgi:hypothetical protein